jgi:hypothetical protein
MLTPEGANALTSTKDAKQSVTRMLEVILISINSMYYQVDWIATRVLYNTQFEVDVLASTMSEVFFRSGLLAQS